MLAPFFPDTRARGYAPAMLWQPQPCNTWVADDAAMGIGERGYAVWLIRPDTQTVQLRLWKMLGLCDYL